MPGYYSYPADPRNLGLRLAAGRGARHDHDQLSDLCRGTARAETERLAQLQTEIGAELDLTPIPNADYGTKFQTTIAGGTLPDLMMFPLPTPDQPRVMDRLFTDLGPFLAGDAIKDFPYLANIPTVSWRPTVSNGTIFAVPQPRSIANHAISSGTT